MYDSYKGGCELEFYPIILDDIDRIEVIRGPAAVAWGVNAVQWRHQHYHEKGCGHAGH